MQFNPNATSSELCQWCLFIKKTGWNIFHMHQNRITPTV